MDTLHMSCPRRLILDLEPAGIGSVASGCVMCSRITSFAEAYGIWPPNALYMLEPEASHQKDVDPIGKEGTQPFRE